MTVTAPAARAVFDLDGPLDLRETLGAGQVGPRDPSLRLGRAEAWRATRTPHGPASQRLRLEHGRLVVESWGLGADWLLDRAARLCGALDDLRNFTPDQPLLRALKHRHPGMRVGRSEAVFEACMRNIVQQRVTVQEAWLNWRSLVRGLGEPAPGTLPDLWLPPPAERVARLPYDMFHRFGIERRRADILRRVALVAARLEEAVTLPLEQAHRRLSSVVGLGPWTTARVALVALGDADAVCLGDLHLPHLISWALAGEPRGSDARMLELLEPYRGHRARVQRLLLIDALSVPRVRQNLA